MNLWDKIWHVMNYCGENKEEIAIISKSPRRQMSLNSKTKSSINQLGQLFTEITNASTCNSHFHWIPTKQSKLRKNVRCPHTTEFKWILKIPYWTILTCMTRNLLHNHHSQTLAMWTKSGISFIVIVSYSQYSVIFCTETI